jgi:hypothetical protein
MSHTARRSRTARVLAGAWRVLVYSCTFGTIVSAVAWVIGLYAVFATVEIRPAHYVGLFPNWTCRIELGKVVFITFYERYEPPRVASQPLYGQGGYRGWGRIRFYPPSEQTVEQSVSPSRSRHIIPGRITQFMFPWWLPMVIFGIVPLVALSRWLLRRRIPEGHCQGCGYNLTGNVSGVCPECGGAIADGSKPAEAGCG